MASGTVLMYGKWLSQAHNKEIDLNDGNVKVALCTSSYTPDQDAHDFFDDITNEVSGTGYTAGGSCLAGGTMTYTGASNIWAFDADNLIWPSSTITARYGIIYYNNAGSAAVSPLIAYLDFTNEESVADNFTIAWHADGIFKVTVS